MDRVRVFSRAGWQIDELRTSCARSYALVTETEGKFSLSVYDPKCNSSTLNYGNIILTENSDGLPPSCGIIDSIGFADGAAKISYFSFERYFTYRRGPRSMTLAGSAGEIFAQMIQFINGEQDTVLLVGDINSRSGYMIETLNPTNLKNNLNRIVQRSGEGYRWRPEVDQGQLNVYADWYPSMIIDTGLILQDGYNVSGDHPLTQSPPLNDIAMYGNGTDWLRRNIAIAVDVESREKYGLRQYSESVSTPSLDVLTLAAATKLKSTKEPQTSFPLSALNKGDTFSKLDIGARATLTRLVGQGFSANGTGYESDNIIILNMTYDPATGEVPLALWNSND